MRRFFEFGEEPLGGPQNTVHQWTPASGGEGDRFENRGMTRRAENEELIESEPQKVARRVVNRRGTEQADPEIEQR